MRRRHIVSPPSHLILDALKQVFARAVPCAALALVLAGCAPWATYPPIPGAAQIGRPEFEPVPTIMAEAVRFTYERHGQTMGMDDQIVFNLPEGTPPHTYERVIQQLGGPERARWMTEEDKKAIHVTSVRVRTTESQVDVIYPRPDGHHEMIMLSMRQRFPNRHVVTASRLWRIHASAPRPHYYPQGGREEYFRRLEAEAHAAADDPGIDQ